MPDTHILMEKIRALPPERIAEVEDFVEFIALREREREFVRLAANSSKAAFAAVWDNSEDDVYNAL